MNYNPKDFKLIYSNLRDLGEFIKESDVQFTSNVTSEFYKFHNTIFEVILENNEILEITSETLCSTNL